MNASFRQFKVVNKVQESTVITSFYLQPEDNEALWPAAAGQYLTLRIPTPDGSVLRTYSISSDVKNTDTYRITVKREAAPPKAECVSNGVGSCWLHDEVEVGHSIEIAPPRGVFVLDENSARPVLLLSGGVGQTPLLSMLHRLKRTSRDAWYLHACENGDVHAMQAEVSKLLGPSEGRIRSVVAYGNPLAADREMGSFDHEGFIDKALLQSLLPIDDYDVYLCGPTAFMVAMYQLLLALGVAKPRIAYEFFGKATALDALIAEEQTMPDVSSKVASNAPASLANLTFITNPDAWGVDAISQAIDRKSTGAGTEQTVVFSRSGLTVDWSSSNTSLLQIAEANGLAPNFSCRSGICNSCKSPLLEGEVEYFEEPLDSPDSNEVLLCCSRPVGRVVIDL